MSQILFILTGGTIDSYYEGKLDTVMPLKNSVVPSFLESLNLKDKLSFKKIFMKDSRSITKSDRNKVLQTLEKTNHKKIVITHGTYTMPDTARFLEANLERKDQTIILTGSMIPLTGFSPSDAPFNLGYSIANVKILKPGIYVCMNGQIFTPKEVIKQLSQGKFISIFNK